MHRFTPNNITELKPNEIFVFGSNTMGKNIGGAARIAQEFHGAVWGNAVGLKGQSYAIPTLKFSNTDLGYSDKLPLEEIGKYIKDYVEFAWNNQHLIFLTTLIGTGIAGFTIEEIGNLFVGLDLPDNLILPIEFEKIILANNFKK